jgi:exonuclease SbcD
VPVILIAGNHDGAERLGFGARQLAKSGLHISGPLTAELPVVSLGDEFGEVDFYSLPYADPATVRDVFDVDVRSHDHAMQVLMAEMELQRKNSKNRSVLLSHCFVDGGESC